jgi:hypothetical protein
MSTPAPENPSVPHSSLTPTISADGHLVTGSGFLPDHPVAVWITCAGEDIDDYLTYVTDCDGSLHSDLPNGVTGKLYIAVTDLRPDPDGACGRLWSNTCSLFVSEA